MKSVATFFLALFILPFAIATPSTILAKDPPAKSSKAKSDDDKKDSTKSPFNGMTKAQAIHYYGEPDSIGHRDGEELWTYVLNRGESIGKSFIPFYYKNNLRYRLLTFKGDKVVKFHWDPPESD